MKKEPISEEIFVLPEQEDFIERIDDEHLFSAETIQDLDIFLTGGNLLIFGDNRSDISVQIQWKHNQPELLPQCRIIGQTLSITTSIKQAIPTFWGQADPYIVEIHLPKNIAVRVRIIAGTLFVKNIQGVLQSHVTLGSIQGFYEGVNFYGRVDAGDIKIHGLTGSAVSTVGVGDIELDFHHLAKTSQVKTRVLAGDISLRFPKELAAKLSTSTDKHRKGRVSNAAQLPIFANVFLGDVTILQR